jgi:hypothetical protein
VAGVVAEDIDLEAAGRALDELGDRGFVVTQMPGPVVQAVRAAVRPAGSVGLDRVAELIGALEALGGADPVGAAIAALVAVGARVSSGVDPAFEQVIEAVTRADVPAPSWFAQARRNAEVREKFLEEFGALTSDEVAELAGSQAANRRATAHRWQSEQRVFSVTHHGQVLYPGFQFDPTTGRPKPAVAQVLGVLPANLVGWARAMWWVTPADELGWARPVDRLDDAPAEVIGLAGVEATEWADAAG